jgi:anaerobic magnesium-protoporphyrin IX monomethyl ester cyclase
MKILLAYISGVPNRDDPFISLLPSGLCYLQSNLREAGFDALLANFSGWSNSNVSRQLKEHLPDVIAISQWTHNRHASLELAHATRRLNPKCTVILGGGHATFQYNEILCQGSPVDAVILGEGEGTLLELIGRLADGSDWQEGKGIAYRRNGTVIVTPSRSLLADLDALPFASLHLEHSLGVDREQQAEFIVTARGCPSACAFCSSPGFWKRCVRFRSPENIVDEILFIRDRYGLIYFSLRDDTFTADRARTIAICRLLIERRAHIIWNCQSRVTTLDEELLVWMKRAGCECVQLGVESGAPRILSHLGKTITPLQVERAASAIRKVGISLSLYLISDIPGETDGDRDATIALMRRIRPDDGYVSPLAYYPGTRLFSEAVADGRVDANVFQKNHAAAVYAAGKPGNTSRQLLRALTGRRMDNGRCFKRQKRILGYCYTTNVLAGEYFRQRGDGVAAELEFLEIIERESENPWGWYLLGELLSEQGSHDRAVECYRRVLACIPNHTPSRLALGQ